MATADWISPKNNGFIAVIDRSNNKVVDLYSVGIFSNDIEFNPNNNHLYVSNEESNSISVIDGDTNKGIELIPVGSGPQQIEFNPYNNAIYVANEGGSRPQISLSVRAADDSTSDDSQNQIVEKLVDFLKELANNPSQLAIPVDSLNEAIEILTDADSENDDQLCDILDIINLEDTQDKENIKKILDC